jgi:hypothetical protein
MIWDGVGVGGCVYGVLVRRLARDTIFVVVRSSV